MKIKSCANLKQVVVGGYYGFGNLGDEAILEQLTNELKNLVSPDQINILSSNPEQTRSVYGIQATNRWNILNVTCALKNARLFISGGGGLFQDKSNLYTPLYYSSQIILSKLFGAKTMVYAQGIGPLQSISSQIITKRGLKSADCICVRDKESLLLLNKWKIAAVRTADPVWRLSPTPAPDIIKQKLDLVSKNNKQKFVGINLRPDPRLSDQLINHLSSLLNTSIPVTTPFLLIALQKDQDYSVLKKLEQKLIDAGREVYFLDTNLICKPSQWLDILNYCQIVISMRLHALIMSLKLGIPVIGMDYDPKVRQLLTEFEQPILNLTNTDAQNNWMNVIKSAYLNLEEFSNRAKIHSASSQKLACQNFELLARILDMQSDNI